ncbi:hypothetical protein Emag_007369 [Eimeria magna]
MVATRGTVRASTRAQRPRRIVARATPPRPKRSRLASTTSGTREAAGLPPRTRARRALLATAAHRAPLRRYLSPARSSSDRIGAGDPSSGPPRRRLSYHHAAAPPAPPSAHRTCMTAQPDPTRTPYEHMVAILVQQVAPGKPEDYLHQTIALIARRTDTQISRLHMQFTEAYDAYRDLCARLRSPPHLGEHFVVTAFLGNLPKDIARDTRSQASAADRLNDLQYVARLAINFDTLARTYPGRGEHRPQDANTLTLNDDFYAPPASADPPADTPPAAPRAPATPPARGHQRTAPTITRFPYLEVDRFGHSYYVRADLPSPAWFHPGLLRAVLAHERPAPQAQQQPSVALVQPHPGAAPPPPANTDPRPTTPPAANPPAAQRAVFCAAPTAPGAPATPPAICNHTRLGTPPRAPKSPTHTRAWATIDGVRCEAASPSRFVWVLSRPRRPSSWSPALPSPLFWASISSTSTDSCQPGSSCLDFRGPRWPDCPAPGPPPAPRPSLCSRPRRRPAPGQHGGGVRTTLAAPATAPASPLVYLVAASTLPGVGLAIPEQLTSGLIAIRNTSDRPLHLSAGWPLAKAVRLPPAAIL